MAEKRSSRTSKCKRAFTVCEYDILSGANSKRPSDMEKQAQVLIGMIRKYVSVHSKDGAIQPITMPSHIEATQDTAFETPEARPLSPRATLRLR